MTDYDKRVLFFVAVLFSYPVEARRVMPPVQRIVHGDIVYSAPHAGRRGGIVVAHDEKTGVQLWEKRIYGVEFYGGEEDIQWILIKSLSATNNLLMIVNENEHAFSLDISTRHVTPLNEDMVPFETSGGSDTGVVKQQPEQLEMSCVILKLKRSDIERLERERSLDVHKILNLLRTGKGVVLAAPRMRVMSGQECVVKSIKEVTFPTEMTFSDGCATNPTPDGQTMQVPSNFDMRETGVIFQCVAEVQLEGEKIRVCSNIQYIEEPSWKRFIASYPKTKGKSVEAGIDQPIFPVYTVEHQSLIMNGETILMGGGIPTIDKESFVYFLLTGRTVKGSELYVPTN